MDQINDSGHRAASRYENISYWDFNWRKNGGSSRMIEISKREHFYQQEYCGCVYSLRDTNRWRRKIIKIELLEELNFTNMTPGKKFRDAIKNNSPLIIPGAINAYSAKIS